MPVLLSAALAAFALDPLDVTVRLDGIDRALRQELREVSSIYRAEDDAFTSLAALRRAADADAEALRAALVSLGYYAGSVEPQVLRTEGQATVTFTIDPGPRFTVTAYEIVYDALPRAEDVAPGAQVAPPRGDRPMTLREAGLKPDGSPRGEDLQKLEAGLLDRLWGMGYPAAEPLGRRVEANFETGEATAVFPMRTGPLSRYANVQVEVRPPEGGTPDDVRTDPQFVRQLRPFEDGDIYRRAEIEEYREALADTGLFREINVQPAPPGYDGSTDVQVTVTERRPRTIQAGASFATDIGPGVTASWENRNTFGRGENLTVSAAVAAPLQEVNVLFEKPRPRLPGSWQLGALLRNEDTDAFTAQTVQVTAALSKFWFDRNLETTGGLSYTASQFQNADEEDARIPGTQLPPETFQAVSFPFAAIWNNEENELNPVDGWRGRFLVEPFVGDVSFTRTQLRGATRYGFGENKNPLIAVRAALGAAYGADRPDIPPTLRYYAGGGGSVRGYAFQEAGPLNAEQVGDDVVYVNGDTLPATGEFAVVGPRGGASLAELNVEGRVFVTDSIQVAVFADTGTTFDSQTPDFSGEFFTGVGAGVRYVTPIGPIRLDVAVPLERRELVATRLVELEDGSVEPQRQTVFEDDPVGIYIALGQPF